MREDSQRCGTITWKGDKDQVHKYNTKTEFIMVIDYPTGREEAIVSAATWASHKVGDRICFLVRNNMPLDFWEFAYFVISIVEAIVFFVISVGMIIEGIRWLFGMGPTPEEY